MYTMHRMFEVTENEFDLPTIGIQQDNLKRCKLVKVGNKSIDRRSDGTLNQAEADVGICWILWSNDAVAHMTPLAFHDIW